MLMVFLAALATVGLASILWMLFGCFLVPVGTPGTMRVSIYASGNGDEVEHLLCGLHWLKTAGLLNAKIDVVDAGLNGAGRAQMQYLTTRKYKNVHFTPPQT